jgi:hypothetical protein
MTVVTPVDSENEDIDNILLWPSFAELLALSLSRGIQKIGPFLIVPRVFPLWCPILIVTFVISARTPLSLHY